MRHEDPENDLLLAFRSAAADRRGDPRFDPRRQRQLEPQQDGRPEHLSGDPAEVLAGQSVPGRVGKSRSPKKPPPQRVRSHQAFAGRADPGGVRCCRYRLAVPGAVHDDAAHAGPRHAQQRVHATSKRLSSPAICDAKLERSTAARRRADSRLATATDRTRDRSRVKFIERHHAARDKLTADEVALRRLLPAGVESERVCVSGLITRCLSVPLW